MKNLEKIFLSKPLCLAFFIGGLAYGIILPFCFGNNPFDEFGTLSILCEDRKIYFWFWVILVGGCNLLNTNYSYKKYGENSKFLKTLSILAFVACCLIALTLKHDVHSWGVKRIIHWIATGLYIALLGLSTFLFFLKNRKKYNRFSVLAICCVALVVILALWLVVIGKSAMMEMIPNAAIQILLFTANFTPWFKPTGAEMTEKSAVGV